MVMIPFVLYLIALMCVIVMAGVGVDFSPSFGEFTGTMVGITCADRLFRRHYADFDFLEYLDELSEKE